MRAAERRVIDLFIVNGLSVAYITKRLRAEAHALTDKGHPTREEVENVLRRWAIKQNIQATMKPRWPAKRART